MKRYVAAFLLMFASLTSAQAAAPCDKIAEGPKVVRVGTNDRGGFTYLVTGRLPVCLDANTNSVYGQEFSIKLPQIKIPDVGNLAQAEPFVVPTGLFGRTGNTRRGWSLSEVAYAIGDSGPGTEKNVVTVSLKAKLTGRHQILTQVSYVLIVAAEPPQPQTSSAPPPPSPTPIPRWWDKEPYSQTCTSAGSQIRVSIYGVNSDLIKVDRADSTGALFSNGDQILDGGTGCGNIYVGHDLVGIGHGHNGDMVTLYGYAGAAWTIATIDAYAGKGNEVLTSGALIPYSDGRAYESVVITTGAKKDVTRRYCWIGGKLYQSAEVLAAIPPACTMPIDAKFRPPK